MISRAYNFSIKHQQKHSLRAFDVIKISKMNFERDAHEYKSAEMGLLLQGQLQK